MVKVGFICEGETEKIIVDSENFQNFLKTNNLEFVRSIDATGNGNLLPKHLNPQVELLQRLGSEKIIVLTDLDEDKCITLTKERIGNNNVEIIIVVSVKKVESWFLADNTTLTAIFGKLFFYHYPENDDNPRDTLQKAFLDNTKRGIGMSKVLFAKKMIKAGFSIENAAKHINCNSAKYFINKLKSIAKET